MKRAEEIEWLRYFYQCADFGPAHEDVVHFIMRDFILKTGKLLPKYYMEKEEEKEYLEDGE